MNEFVLSAYLHSAGLIDLANRKGVPNPKATFNGPGMKTLLNILRWGMGVGVIVCLGLIVFALLGLVNSLRKREGGAGAYVATIVAAVIVIGFLVAGIGVFFGWANYFSA